MDPLLANRIFLDLVAAIQDYGCAKLILGSRVLLLDEHATATTPLRPGPLAGDVLSSLVAAR